MGNTRATFLKLPPSLDARLTALARARRTSRSAVLRDALEAFDTSMRSVTQASGDLVGCVSGPADLSSSPRRMAGYGR